VGIAHAGKRIAFVGLCVRLNQGLAVCLDPASIELLDDFYADRSTTKLLELECEFSDDYLRGHAQRVVLAGADTSDDTMKTLLLTIRYDVTFENEQIDDRGYPNHFKFAEDQSTQKMRMRLQRS
ncbi:DUF5928 domain-containing protein, partial [Nereida sp.]|uniref:DUF5928 domain-containing protein n=1 Tax=Nereida sp. TaxID=2736090 RepID=UPI003F6A0286